MSLSEYITKYLQDHNMSLNELSRQCGISKGYMSMIVKGHSSGSDSPIVPSIKILQRLANGTGTTLNDLCATVDSYVDLHQSVGQEVMQFAPAAHLTDEESDVIEAYRGLSDEGKDMVCGMLHVTRQVRSSDSHTG